MSFIVSCNDCGLLGVFRERENAFKISQQHFCSTTYISPTYNNAGEDYE